ncbi:MAG: OB-fold nucleic acid binding domain-containing protein, partial [Gammaproteobacteria bacterium]
TGVLFQVADSEFAERVFQQIQGFGEYGFPESHAASFALLVYVSAWLKCHEPAAFYCGLLNSLPMGFYSASQLVQDAQRHGIRVLGVDVQQSDWDHAVPEPMTLRLGLRLVKGLPEHAGRQIVAVRRSSGTRFRDVQDLAQRADLDARALRCLARAGALAQLAGHRHEAHWLAAGVRRMLPIEANPVAQESAARLPAPGIADDMLNDYRYVGLTLGPHPLAVLRAHPLHGSRFARYRTADALATCRHGQFVRVAGLVTGRQRPSTATGVLFVTLEDETGNINLVVWASVFERFRSALLQGRLLCVNGSLERHQEVIHVVAGLVEDRSDLLSALATGPDSVPFVSRDFH